MITVVRVCNPFEPFRRETVEVPFCEGMSTTTVARDFDSEDLVAGAVALNGEFILDGAETILSDGDFVMLVFAPAGEIEVIKFLVYAIIASAISVMLMPKLDQPEDPDSTYGYYGFRNSYLPEGSPVPVVYGKMRYAPPCINQSIIGGSPTVSDELLIGTTETMNAMYAISEGPIYGIGEFQGAVGNDVERDSVISDASGYDATTLASGMGLQINGIDGESLEGAYNWRTGEPYQDPMIGDNGYLNVNYAGTTYALGFAISEGTAGITETDYAEGLYDYVDRIGGASSSDIDTTQFVSLQLTEKADLLNVQAFFPKGLFSDGQDANPDTRTVKLRLQYWETDSSGTALSQVRILPAIEITESLQRTFSADFRIPFLEPQSTTFSTGGQGGFFYVFRKSSLQRLYNSSAGGIQKLTPPGAGSADQKFSGAAWISPRDQDGNNGITTTVFYLGNRNTQTPFQPEYYKTSSGSGNWKAWAPNDEDLTNAAYLGWAFTWGRTWEDTGSGGTFQAQYRGFRPQLMAWDSAANKWSRWIADPADWQGTANTWDNDGSIPWLHVGFTYDGSKEGADRVKFSIAGINSSGRTVAGSIYEEGDGGSAQPQWPSAAGSGDAPVFNVIGYAGTYGSNTTLYESRSYVCGAVMCSGILSEAWFDNAVFSTNVFNQKNFRPSSMQGDPNALLLLDIFTLQDTSGSPYYKNYAYPDATTEAEGVIRSNTASTTYYKAAPNSSSPLFSTFAGVTKNGYYKVTVDSITTFTTQDYTYPATAVISTSLTATEEVNNSTPEITMIVHGKTVPVWDGTSEVDPTMTIQWSNNPAWVALDMLTNSRYGMGSVFSPDGRYDLIDLPSFLEWANFCDEGVQDGYGDLFFFGLRTDNHITDNESPAGLYLYFGLRQGVNDMQEMPGTWAVGYNLSIKSVIDGIPNFVTAADVVGGLNNASNLLEMYTFEPFFDDAGFHGWNTYVRVKAVWNRTDEDGDRLWPDGVTEGEYLWADELTIGSTTLIVAITSATQNIIQVDDWNVFAALDFNPATQSVKYYADITSGGVTESVEIMGVSAGSTPTVTIMRGQLGTTALAAASIGDTVALKAGAFLGVASGYDTRAQFDGVFDKKESAGWDALLQVFQAGRAMPVKAGSKIIAVVDQPRDPVALFTQANIKDGSLEISYLGIKDAPNAVSATFLNKDRNYENESIIVDHPSTYGQAGYCSIGGHTDEDSCVAAGGTWTLEDFNPGEYATRRQETLEARGVTRRNQVTRDATYRLNRYYLQRRGAKFDVGPDAIHLLPGDRVLVSHDVPQYGYSGRIPEEGGASDNLWPFGGPGTTTAPSLYQSMGTPGDGGTGGGPLWRGTQTVMTVFQPEAVVPPLTAYSQNQLPDGKGVAMFRGTPMNSAGTVPAGAAADGTPIPCFDHNKGGTGSYATWAIQFGYPGDGAIKDHGVDLDVIASATHKSCFSVYVREPAKGATRGDWRGADSHRGEFRRRNNAVSR